MTCVKVLSSFLFLYYNIVGFLEGPPELTIRLFPAERDPASQDRTIRSRLMERSKADLIPLSGIKEVLYMVVVKKMPGESEEALIRRFSRTVVNENLLPEIKRRGFYLKPSAARQYKQQERRRLKKAWLTY